MVVSFCSSLISIYNHNQAKSQHQHSCSKEQFSDDFIDWLDWISFSRESNFLLTNLLIFGVCSIILTWRRLYELIVGSFTTEHRNIVQLNFMRLFPMKHCIILRALDHNISSSSFDFLVLFLVYTFVSVTRMILDMLEKDITLNINNLTEISSFNSVSQQ